MTEAFYPNGFGVLLNSPKRFDQLASAFFLKNTGVFRP